MLSKARIKYIKSLQVKKYRQQEQRFVVEGEKSVVELLHADFHTDVVLVTDEFIANHSTLIDEFEGEVIRVKAADLGSLGELKTNDAVLAVARIKPNEALHVSTQEFALVLDDLRDPGNLGTIIRIADWYGLTKIFASPETADFYNPKVIHASMGSFTRVKLCYTDLEHFLAAQNLPILGAFLDGEDVHQLDWGGGGLIVIGNESHGISVPVEKLVTNRITIPKYGKAESLNAAVATAVICDNIRRSWELRR